MRITVSASLVLAVLLASPAWSTGTCSEAEQLVVALQDDAVYYNATASSRILQECGEEVVGPLEQALADSDYQKRQLAAEILRGRQDYVAPDILFEVTVEGLQDDNLPYARPVAGQDYGRYTPCENATNGMAYLLAHMERAEPYLQAALGANDVQQRFLAAYLLAWQRRQAGREAVVTILIDHLQENHILGDACMAASALYRLGPAVAPRLWAALGESDAQGDKTIRLILYDFSHPFRADDPKRHALQVISRVPDPCLHYSSGWKAFGHLWPDD
jgi:hypothetical protein